MPSRKKLTLSVDEKIIQGAHRYSERHGTSISRLVSDYLARLAESEPQGHYPAVVRRLIGILPGDVSVDEHQRHLEQKHAT